MPTPTNIIVLGKGYLGSALYNNIDGAVYSSARIDNWQDVQQVANSASLVINCAGATGRPNVDWCEEHPAETVAANTLGPIMLADACKKAGTFLIHIGSGCIFYGLPPDNKLWTAKSDANPCTVYTRSKYAADLALMSYDNVTIVRPRMPLGSVAHPRNLITKLVNYKKVIDVANSVTVLDDFITAVQQCVKERYAGVVHAVNPGAISHKQILELYKQYVDWTHEYQLIDTNQLITSGLAKTQRSSVVLDSTKWLNMRPIAEAILVTMRNYH